MRIKNIIILAMAILCVNACKDDDDFSTDQSKRLTYSRDTIKFEPLLTDITTSTRTLKIYNRSGENIRIEEIELMSENDNFQLNINGKNEQKSTNIELKDGDSIYVFVRARPAKAEDASQVQINDEIRIRYNGNQDVVVLNAVASNATVFRNKTITADTTWMSEQPFLIYDTLRIAEGAKLTIMQGCEILWHNNAVMVVDGQLDVRGNATAPVLMSGERYDKLTSKISYTKLAKQWDGIVIGEKSYGNYINGALIVGTTNGITVNGDSIYTDEIKLTLGSTTVKTSSNGTLTTKDARVYAYNCLFANGGLKNVTIEGGSTLLLQCTLAEYSLDKYFNCLMVMDSKYSKTKFYVSNSIIYGSSTNEIDLSDSTDVTMFNSLLKDKKYVNDTTIFMDCVWNIDPKFKEIKPEILSYDFHITKESGAKGIGSAEIISMFPECWIDMSANLRDENVDAGCYIATEE